MLDHLLTLAMLGTLGLGALLVMIGAWLTKKRGAPDWLMAVGALIVFLCFGLIFAGYVLSAAFFGLDFGNQARLGIAMGVLLFSLGYLMDRLAYHRQLSEQFPGSL